MSRFYLKLEIIFLLINSFDINSLTQWKQAFWHLYILGLIYLHVETDMKT